MTPELLDIIRGVRRRWRMKVALRGASGVAGLGVAVLLAGAYLLEVWRFTPAAIVTFRIGVGLAFVALLAYLFARPLLRRVTDEQVALYLEEHEPSLQEAIISAVEASRAESRSPASAALVRKLVQSAVEKCGEIEAGRRLERTPIRRYAIAVAAIVLAACAVFVFGPAYLRHALSALVIVSRDVEAAAPYRIEVSPGNATVHRGADQTITATLDGFDASQAVLMVRKNPDAGYDRLPLVRGDGNQFEGMVFNLASPVDYFVEADGVRSPVFTLKVVDLPYVQRLELEYRFPAYTGLPPRKVEDGGDIAVLKGTEIHVRAVPTMATRGGEIVVDDSTRTPLAAQADGALTASFRADHDGFYRIELDAPTGDRVPASPQYTIDVLADQEPTVSIARPGRDTTASPIEEVFVEARAEDDYGVKDLDLVYSVNGGPEKTVRLFDGTKRLAEVSAGHTFYLEELSVKPGDFVSYYAKALDNDTVQGPKTASSDMYFVRVRPLKKEFRQAPSMAGGAGGGGGGGEVGALSDQQRKIIAATFNVQRDRKKMTAAKLRENAIVIALSQARLREQVEGLVTRMNSRLVQQDPAFKKIADLLPQAVAEMKGAETRLREPNPGAALSPEQRALQFLQKAEEEYELQVSVNRQQGGGGGGGSAGSMAEDLADLFELELDRMANQYETSQRASQQNADQKIDELAEKLKELARRQEQEAERQRRRAAAGQQASGGGGGQQQRELADQAEEAARRLEQLSREENRADLMDSARRLREAADAMRRAAANGAQASAAESTAALERLRDAERKLQQSQSGRAERDIRDALRQAEELAQEQKQIADDVNGVEASGAGRQQKVQQLNERKQALDAKVGDLEKQLDRTAGDLRQKERDAARRLAGAADSIRDNRVRDKIRYSQSLLRAGVSPEDERAMEQEIGSNLEDLRKKVGDAAAALGRSKPDTMSEALDKARQLARGMESLDERMRERAGRGQNDQGQEGRQGRQGQQGRSGQQGQQGQSGQRGGGGQMGGQGRGDAGDGRNGIGDTTGPWRPGGGFGDRRPGNARFSDEDVRQFRSEARQWTAEAEQLRRMLQGQKLNAKELEDVLRGLRALQDDRVYQNVGELQRLQSEVTESMKRFEYTLRRRAEGNDQVLLSGSDDVPEQFRKLVDQYYKALSKAPEKK